MIKRMNLADAVLINTSEKRTVSILRDSAHNFFSPTGQAQKRLKNETRNRCIYPVMSVHLNAFLLKIFVHYNHRIVVTVNHL